MNRTLSILAGAVSIGGVYALLALLIAFRRDVVDAVELGVLAVFPLACCIVCGGWALRVLGFPPCTETER